VPAGGVDGRRRQFIGGKIMPAKRSRGFCILVLAVLLTGGAARQLLAQSPGSTGPRSAYTSADDSTASQIERNGALITPPVLRTGEGLAKPPIGGLIAYSLKAAQARLLAFAGTSDWRRRDPELFTLAGITRPEGVVVDQAGGDVILIGHAEEGDAPLTLDDFVVALRARWIDGKWPVVSIDPVPGKATRKGDPQIVHFEGGIQNTQFGADLLDADHRLKRMALGMLVTGVPGLASEFERRLERDRSGTTTQAEQIGGRFWFEPVQDRVIVRDGVVQLGPMTVSVFTELLSATVGGHKLDPKSYHDEVSDAFAKDISSRFNDVARAHPSVARVRGLNGIVAVVAGLERVDDDKPFLDYWLQQYAVRTVKTPSTVTVLQRIEQVSNGSTGYRLSIEGGVELQAIAVALQSGDVSALRRAVLIARPEPAAVSWRLIIGQWVMPLSQGVLSPSALGPISAQTTFLSRQRRWDDVITVMNDMICIAPDNLAGLQNQGVARQSNEKLDVSDDCSSIAQSDQESRQYLSLALTNRGRAYDEKGQHDRAIRDYDQAIRLDATQAETFINRGRAYGDTGQYDRAIQDFDQAIRLNPNISIGFNNRGVAYLRKGQYDRAIQDYTEAIRLAPNDAEPFLNRCTAYARKTQYDRAIRNCDQAIQLNPNYVDAFTSRGVVYFDKGQYDRAIQDNDQAIRLNPNYVDAYVNRCGDYLAKRQHDRAIQDCDKAIRLNPNVANAFANRCNAYADKSQYDRAIKDCDQAIRLNPNYADAFNNRGVAYLRKGQYDRAIQDFNQAIRLNPTFAYAFNGRGLAKRAKGDSAEGDADIAKARQLNPNLPSDVQTPNTLDQQRCSADDPDVSIGACTALIQTGQGPQQNLVAALGFRGNAYARKRQYDRAIEDYNQAIRLNPNEAGAFIGRGIAYTLKGQGAPALLDFDQAIRLAPQEAKAFVGRGFLLRALGEDARADADFAKARQLNPNLQVPTIFGTHQLCNAKTDPDVSIGACTALIQSGQQTQQNLVTLFHLRGNAFTRKGQYDRAIEDYNQAIRLNPDETLFAGRGVVYFDKGQYDRAIQDFDQAIRLNRNYAQAFAGRGNTYLRKGEHDRATKDYDQAIRLLEQAIRLNPNDANAFVLRGLVKRTRGDSTGGDADVAKARQLNPNLPLP
jgi:tetratricopeptide (TPR) repeat protein